MQIYTSVLAILALTATPSLSLPIDAQPEPVQPVVTPRQGSMAATINAVLAMVENLLPNALTLAAAEAVIVPGTQALATTVGIDTTQDALNDGTPCHEVILVFARGTFEPGNMGSLVGPELVDAMMGTMAPAGMTMAVQGVENYPASVPEYLQGGSPSGSAAMAASVMKAKSKCPQSAIVMSGYSQGAQIVHNAADQLGPAGMANVKAVVTFGDPDSTKPVTGIDTSRHLVICHAGDDICQFGDIIGVPHLTYAEDTPKAASFIMSNIQ